MITSTRKNIKNNFVQYFYSFWKFAENLLIKGIYEVSILSNDQLGILSLRL